jgi:hypothetical protein
MEHALRKILPRIVGELSFEIYTHQSKHDLLSHLPNRLRGYASWLPNSWKIVAIIDRDDDDCAMLKAKLEDAALSSGLTTRSSAGRLPYTVVNRLAIEELEAWYFGDWPAVKAAYPRVPISIPRQAKYRDPDAILGGTWEAFERIMKKAGYFTGGLRKIEAATEVASHMNVAQNSSRSFQEFRDALMDLVSGGAYPN